MVLAFCKRPASPLHLESVAVLPEDVLYPGSEDDELKDDDSIEKKSLRRESLGRQYLDGKPLFIQTARLRGPFDKGWANPWACKKRKYGVDDIRRFPQEPAAIAKEPGTTDAEDAPSPLEANAAAADKCDVVPILQDKETALFMKRTGLEQPICMRSKATEQEHIGNGFDIRDNESINIGLQGDSSRSWLKTDRPYQPAYLEDQPKSPTPTPIPSAANLAVIYTDESLAERRAVLSRSEDQRYSTPSASFTPENKIASTEMDNQLGQGARSPSSNSKSQKARFIIKIVETPVTERLLASVDEATRLGHEGAKQLSQKAMKMAEQDIGLKQARKLSQEAASRLQQSATRSSRLAPYVSEALNDEHVRSSAGLKAESKSLRPSPRVEPPSTFQSEFRYHYARKRTSTSSQEESRYINAQEMFEPRSRSNSSSSSKSSEFAAEYQALQAKAESRPSSYSSSPALSADQETASVKRNRQAMKRLTFTSSGKPAFTEARGSSMPASLISKHLKSPSKEKMEPPRASSEIAPGFGGPEKPIQRLSKLSKSSESLANLPEAQPVPDAPMQLSQVTPVSSTNLLETDKHPPKYPSLDEEDSYFDLSTQAAVIKAQQRFHEETLIEVPGSSTVTRNEITSPIHTKSGGAHFTPAMGTARKRGGLSKLTKPDDSEEEEPMSTQAMVDAMSPFAITTVKKSNPRFRRSTSSIVFPTKRKSPGPALAISPGSPTKGPFEEGYISMSTSPSPSPPKPSPPVPLSHPNTTSKPTSSLTSFSILPNGTLTETSIYQDGQQQENLDISLPPDPFGTAYSTTNRNVDPLLDSEGLNAAIADAGSFLGDWDVETAARKEGSLSKKREMGSRGILSSSRGNE